jgi:acetyl-CoA acetyltransferase
MTFTYGRPTQGRGVSIVGVGSSPYAKRSGVPLQSLVVAAIQAAVADAGLATSDIDGIVTESSLTPVTVPPDAMIRALRIRDLRFQAHLGIAGAGIVAAPLLAARAIEAGLADVVVSYFGVDFGSDAAGPYGFHAHDPAKSSAEIPFGWYGQPVYFAGVARRYRHEYGLAAERLGEIAVAARTHARTTDDALMTDELTIEQYLASPMIADPLRRNDCCLVNDGATAVVLAATDRARDLRRHPVEVAGGALATSPDTQSGYFTQATDYLSTPAVYSAPAAFAAAGRKPGDVDVAEIYDCFTISLLLQLEDLGFCARGEGGDFVADGRIRLGGELPVNTHGGLLSHSYVLGGHHVVEAVRQLRHARGGGQVAEASLAAVTGLGVPEHSTLLLERVAV